MILVTRIYPREFQVKFEQNFDKIDNQMQTISGMGYNTWRALSKKGELSMVDDAERVEFTEDEDDKI